MKTMKKICKRILTLVLTASLTLVCPIMASAAELDEGSLTEVDVITSSDTFDPALCTGMSDYTDTGIMLYRTDLLSESVSGMTMNRSYETHCAMAHDGYVVVKCDVTGSAKIKVTYRNGLFWATAWEDTVTNGTSWKISNAVIPEGYQIYVTVTSLQNTTSFTLNVWIE